MLPSLISIVPLAIALSQPVSAWSAIGHEITATIAQAHLTPQALSAIAQILPDYSDGHLAPIAAWADSIRWAHRETSGLHYVNAIGDDPGGPDGCSFGEHGWVDKDRNLLAGVGNYTWRVKEGEGDIPLRFLVHFLGDLHQPLHLAGKQRGGNQQIVKFEGRRSNLHSVWDGLLIQKSIRELGNYTTPLPSKRIEKALRGKIYDPYIRFIITEGIRGIWRNESLTWAECTQYASSVPYDVSTSFSEKLIRNLSLFMFTPSKVASFFTQLSVSDPGIGAYPDKYERDNSLPVCPWEWAKESHPINCKYVWPMNLQTLEELNTPEYYGRLKADWVVEKQLARGGLRLAAVLNTLFDSEARATGSVYPLED
ncbi:S1/P1 nuclease [Phaffia rhodozyma]|uniref:S1/P1 nuclease n=1 Tax=Phaffia rhodozyma TaxID=264483 RepID=A0A0F7SQF0_PHARH|nr:S1/P1 nuclease [Phaffia rhodozyma]